jgi:glycosyltransferase involved in cell wall biosynthesis
VSEPSNRSKRDADGRPLGILYLCYFSLEDPLAHTQVVAYLSGLAAAGHRIHLMTFEPRLTRAQRSRWREQMAARGISWHGLRYHKRPSLPATVYDALAGAVWAAVLARRERLDAFHARTHVPAAMALIARRLSGGRRAMVFDLRGLMVEEYEEAGRWRPGGLASRLTLWIERLAIRRAERTVVLTERVREQRFTPEQRRRVQVIPCCADLTAVQALREERDTVRAELDLADRTVMVYVGKFPSWSMPAAMADFFAVARERLPELHFLVLTQADTGTLTAELVRNGIAPDCYTITSAPHDRVGAYLAAADFAITFITTTPSAIANSPTKVGEYLAAGLPIVHSAGVGDLDSLLTPDIGVRVSEHQPDDYRRAVHEIEHLRQDPATADRCGAAAERLFSLETVGLRRYRDVYDAVGAQLRDGRPGITQSDRTSPELTGLK